MSAFVAGMKDYLRALRLARRRSLWPWLVLPGLVSLAYVPVTVSGSILLAGRAEEWLRQQALPEFLQYRVVSIVLTLSLWVAALYAGFLLFRHVIMIVCAPLLGYISARTEEAARQNPAAASASGIVVMHPVAAALRAVGMSLAGLAVAVAGLVAGLALLLIPVLGGVLMTIWLTVLQMFLAGHGFMDPTWERRGLGVRPSLALARRHRLRTLGLGAGFVMFTSIPIVGWFLGPTLGVVAGTLSALDLEATDPAFPSANGLREGGAA